MTRPWHEIDVTERWREAADGWIAPLPELFWLGGACRALQVFRDGEEMSGVRHDGQNAWVKGDNPARDGARVIAALPSIPAAADGLRYLILGELDGPFHPWREGWRTDAPVFNYLLAPTDCPPGSPLVALEDGRPLGRAWLSLKDWGAGPCWMHDDLGRMVVVTADGSNPATNGRRYTLALAILEGSREPVAQWPAGGPFRRLSDGAALPIYGSLGVTNKCNLRCAICGSQKSLDRRKAARRFMDFDKFKAIAAATFPFLRQVELNSLGEPTLHPRFAEMIDEINRRRCLIKLQTNATLLRPDIIDSLGQSYGSVWMSVDAVGALFERVRAPGKWADVESGVSALMARRDPQRLRIGLYPTLTRRTLPGILDVLDWALSKGIDFVHFHSYEPIQNGEEERPAPSELAAAKKRVADWLTANPQAPDIQIDFDWMKLTGMNAVPDGYLKLTNLDNHNSFPMAAGMENAHPTHLCQAPWQQLDFGLDGEFYVCCRSDKLPLGHAGSFEDFAADWWGLSLNAVRRSLGRDKPTADILPGCAPCVEQSVGLNLRRVISRSLGTPLRPPFQADGGHAFTAAVPDIPVDQADDPENQTRSVWLLYEDERPLGPGHCGHDLIRSQGLGAFSHWGQQVYFSTSDNSDPNFNRRRYTLRPSDGTRPSLAVRVLGYLTGGT